MGELVYGPRAGVGTWLTVGVTAAALCVPVVAVIAVPRLSTPSTLTTSAGAETTAVGPPGRIDAQLTQLPIVITDFSDAKSQRAAAEYTSLRVQLPRAAASMFSDTWVSLMVTQSSVNAASSLGQYLVSAPTPGAYVPTEVHEAASAAVAGLTADPRNADRLSNAAVALFDFGLSWNQTFQQRSVDSPFLVYGSTLQDRATSLLTEVNTAFPPNRASLLNEAYLTSAVPATCGSPLGNFQRGLVPAMRWLRMAPEDTTARVLVASLESRDPTRMTDSLVPGGGDQPSALHDALAALAPVAAVSSTAPLGHAAAGDAYLSAAWAVAGQAPYLAVHYADLARREYMTAQALINDPGLWSGIAASLDILGDNHGALVAQRSAVALMPGSPELSIGLALQEERVGDFRAMRTAAQQALALSFADTNAPFRDVRFIASSPGRPLSGDRGYLGSSFGKDRSRAAVYNNGIGGCGGGGFFTTDAIPAVDDQQINDQPYFLPLPDAAVLTAIGASLVLSDPSTAESDAQKWKQAGGTSQAAATDSLWLDRVHRVDSVALQAVHLVAQGSVQPGTDPFAAQAFAESHLRQAAYVSGQAQLFSQAAVICSRMVRGAGLACEGESAYYAGDYKTASTALESFYRASQLPAAGTEAAIAIWKSGRPDAAHQLLLDVLGGQDPQDPNFIGAREILGEVLLDQGDPRAAIDQFQEALNGIKRTQQPGGSLETFVRIVYEHAFNNHGVAILWRAQSAPGATPDCGPDGTVCQQAHDDFANAISMDPNNPYYLQNAGWSDRLLKHDSAAKSELQAAVQSGPDNYPALNDLGVMAAQDGDLSAARQAFESSLRARPEYDLAAWNLGVLDMREGSFEIIAAQAYLARAVRENPQLRGNPLIYQTDNRIYRAAFGQPLQPALAVTSLKGYSEAAAATGGIAAFSALGDTFGLELKGKLTELLSQLKLSQLGALVVRPGVARPRLQLLKRTPRAIRTWLVTALVLAVGTVWGAFSTSGVSAGSQLLLAALATALAILVHECGHLVAACVARTRMAPAPSPAGIAISALLIPLHISSGPYAGHRLVDEPASARASWVYLAGPLSNLGVATLAYVLYLIQPLPFLLLLAGVQLAAAGFSLMPFEPLDGEALSRRRSHHGPLFALLVFGLSLIAAVAGAALALGKI